MAQPTLGKSHYANIKCLLIEDSEFDQRRVRRVLDELGIQHLSIVDSIGTARAFLSRQRVDLILLDNGLPDGLGVDFALELKERPGAGKTPVVIISDWPTPFMFDKALMASVRQVLRKDEFNLAKAAAVLNLSRGMPKPKPSSARPAQQ
jgi:CheY-like chemotaxis protein